MNRTFLARLSKIEAAQSPPTSRIAILPHDARSMGAECFAAARAETVREYEARHGFPPSLLVITGVPR